jgi:hypothetical protein
VVWSADSRQLRESLWCRQPTAVVCQYAVTNLGFAQLTASPRAVRIRWRPTSTTRETLVGLVQVLLDQPDGRVVISSLHADWEENLYSSADQARSALLRSFETLHCDVGGYYKAVQRRADSLPDDSPIARILEIITMAKGQFAPIPLWQMLDDNADGRFMLTEPQGDRGPLKIIAWGNGYQHVTREGATGPADMAVEDLPDANYAKTLAMAYRAVAATGLPAIEDIETSAWWPGRGRARFRYTRLIVPVTLQGDRHIVLSTAQAGEAI